MSSESNVTKEAIKSALLTAPFVDEKAPFSAEQRLWLNGLLTGLTVIARAKQGPSAESGPKVPLTILFGSQSGTSEALAKLLRKQADKSGFETSVAELDSFDRDKLSTLERLLIVTSTFGEGDPPDNAAQFYQWITSDEAVALPNTLNYSVCALGDRSYTHFNKCGIDIDERMAALGANRITPRVECDVDYDESFESWRSQVFSSEVMAVGGSVDVVVSDAGEASGGYDRKNPFPAMLLASRNLNGTESAKRTHHIEFSLAGSGLIYEVGDALGVRPVNSLTFVQELVKVAGLKGTEEVSVKSDRQTLIQALLQKDLSTVSEALIESLSSLDMSKGMVELLKPENKSQLEGRQVIDLFELFDLDLSRSVEGAQILVDGLRALQPRLYSIASSIKAHPNQVHLTVGVVQYSTHGRQRRGVASNFLADRLAAGGCAGVFINTSPHFRLPTDASVPVIMVGPGTGIAPFRAFLEEREATSASGKNWLFFGDQHQSSDFLYREELEAKLSSGVLSRLDTAWSRDQEKKIYVQDRMLEASKSLFSWLQEGAHFYVCGDASRMAKDVDDALRKVIASGLGVDSTADSVQEYIQSLKDSHRYARDVY